MLFRSNSNILLTQARKLADYEEEASDAAAGPSICSGRARCCSRRAAVDRQASEDGAGAAVSPAALRQEQVRILHTIGGSQWHAVARLLLSRRLAGRGASSFWQLTDRADHPFRDAVWPRHVTLFWNVIINRSCSLV